MNRIKNTGVEGRGGGKWGRETGAMNEDIKLTVSPVLIICHGLFLRLVEDTCIKDTQY